MSAEDIANIDNLGANLHLNFHLVVTEPTRNGGNGRGAHTNQAVVRILVDPSTGHFSGSPRHDREGNGSA